ncbi:GNAT family N-acetyltransferase [Bacillus subtilis]|nr:GNAT family N-acetyltransferase [Bacillus subtilis]
MADVVVRSAHDRDVPALVELRGEMFTAMGVTEQDPAWREQARLWFIERLENPSYCIVVIEVTGAVVACAMGAIRDAAPSPAVPVGRDVLISNVCVFPSARGNGYGRAAFTAVMNWARAAGVGRAELLATSAGTTMYREAGFTHSEHPVMRAALTQPAPAED